LFVVKNINEFKHNFDVHSINTRHRADLFPPTTTLSKYKFKAALKKFILFGSFYTLDEYYDWNPMSDLGTLI